jgi:hypothetical protein
LRRDAFWARARRDAQRAPNRRIVVTPCFSGDFADRSSRCDKALFPRRRRVDLRDRQSICREDHRH